jgi:hypothetical protein
MFLGGFKLVVDSGYFQHDFRQGAGRHIFSYILSAPTSAALAQDPQF